MKLLTYGKISSIAIDPIEKKPLYHFYQGTKVLSAGSWGCNFRCMHCQNWTISQPDTENKDYINKRTSFLSPEEFVELALEHRCEGVCWTYNEPSIWLEYTLDCAKLAKEKNLYTAYITNGYITIEALELISPYLDAYRVDIKSFDDVFYKTICGVKTAKPVFDAAKRAKELGMHIEAVTNIITGYNDSVENLSNIAKWIVENLGKDTPWHVTRFFPNCRLNNLPPTPLETIEIAFNTGKQAGLSYVYKGNV